MCNIDGILALQE